MGLPSASAALAACARQGQTNGITDDADTASDAATASPLFAIIHTNDTHGHDVVVKAEGDREGNFSMAAVPALKAEWEAKGYEVFVVDAGDATQGMPLVDNHDGAPAIVLMNSCGYEFMAVGNHEFDWGPEALAANEAAANFPFLSANVLNKADGTLRFVPNMVVELADGTKVGFFGLTTPTTLTAADPGARDHI